MLYQEAGATPSNMVTAYCAMGVGALKGSRNSTRDAKKAYIQSYIDVPARPEPGSRCLNSYGLNLFSTLKAAQSIETQSVSFESPFTATLKVDKSGTKR